MPKRSPKGKADPRGKIFERGRRLLAAWGIHEGTLPPGTPAPQVVTTLSPLIGRDPACDVVIAEWLGSTTDAASAERLASWETAAADKELKREIRRALFRLEQKGIRVERVEAPRPAFSLGVKAAEPEGFLGGIDGDGSRLAWLLRRDTGGYFGLFTVINDHLGMVSVSAGTMTKAHLGETLKEMDSSESGAPVRVPWTYADALMHAAFRIAAPRPGHARADYLLARSEITKSEAATAAACPVRGLIPPDSVAAPDLLDTSAELFREKEFGTWALPHDAARSHIQAIVNLNSSGLVLSKETTTERMTAILDEALDEFAASDLRAIFARRLEEMAHLFHLQGRERPARLALSVALALDSPGERRMKEISFLRAFVFRAFLPTMMRERGARQTEHDHDHAEAAPPASEVAEGASRILDPSKVRETGVQGAGPIDDPENRGLIIRP
jgi:hypothetical protein